MYWVALLCLVAVGGIALWVDLRDRRRGRKRVRVHDAEAGQNAELPRGDTAPWKDFGG